MRAALRLLGHLIVVVVALGPIAFAHTFSIHQINWLSPNGGYLLQNSEWGTVNVQFLPGDESEFVATQDGYFGYLQVVTWPGMGGVAYNWAVANKLILIRNTAGFAGRLPDAFSFNLGLPRGYDVTTDRLFRTAVLITPAPLDTMPNVQLNQPQYLVPVTTEDWLWGNGLAGEIVPPLAQNFFVAADAKDKKLEAKITIEEKDVEAIDEEVNGCGPGGAARSLKYMEKTRKIKNLNQTAQQVYDTLKGNRFMNTQLGAGGNGTTNDNFKKGKDAYSQNKTLKIETDFTFTAGVLKSDIMDPMNAGADVEIIIERGTNQQGQKLLGHIAFVSEIILTLDAREEPTGFQVKIIDDPVQGDGKASNRSQWLNFKANGDLDGWGPGAKLDRFVLEAPPQR